MTDQTYATGDRVQLKSGGTPMTVNYGDMDASDVSLKGKVPCTWMSEAGELHERLFEPVLLERYFTQSELIDRGAQLAIERRLHERGVF